MDYRKEEAGLEADKPKVDMKLLKKQIMVHINDIAQTDPAKAKEIEEFVFTHNEFDDAVIDPIPEEEIKMYPGSILGPEPEDDIDSWSKWYYEHQPKSAFKDGNINGADIGVKTKFLKPKEESTTTGEQEKNHLFMKPVDRYLETDELYPTLATYDGRAEFAMFNKKNYDLTEGSANPELTF